MANRLEPLNLIDFTGGLNLRVNQFQLKSNESPEMNNISIDPLGGIYTRKGWHRWNKEDIVDLEVEPWDPRRAFLHQLSDGSDVIYIAAGGKVYWSREDGNFAVAPGLVADATPHDCDFASWGNLVYFACGREEQGYKRDTVGAFTALLPAGGSNWVNDYTMPVGGVAPQAELYEAHSGYMFAANITEDGLTFPNRVRWSHPNAPEDWAATDFIDIEIGGSRITGMISFEDHLLIFKNDSMWALYGYELDSWQLVQKSTTVGAISPQGVTRSETAAFFYSASDNGAIYAYNGERPQEISQPLRAALGSLIRPELVWVGWIGRKLWVTLPWQYGGPTDENAAVFVFDPTVGDGAWMYFTSKLGSLGPIVAYSGVDSQPFPLAVVCSTLTAAVVQLESIQGAYDHILQDYVLGTTAGAYIVTGLDNEIMLTGPELEGVAFDTSYRTGWLTADWPTRKKSWRRPDFVCRETGRDHQLQVRSYRDYEENEAKRQYALHVPSVGQVARWGEFNWGDGTQWGAGPKGASIRRGSSFGMCRALQLRVQGLTPREPWGIDAIVAKVVLRRFR